MTLDNADHAIALRSARQRVGRHWRFRFKSLPLLTILLGRRRLGHHVARVANSANSATNSFRSVRAWSSFLAYLLACTVPLQVESWGACRTEVAILPSLFDPFFLHSDPTECRLRSV